MRLYLTSDHGLKSNKAYDFSQSIADTKYLQLAFTNYKEDRPEKTWYCIVGIEQLYNLLNNAGLIREEE